MPLRTAPRVLVAQAGRVTRQLEQVADDSMSARLLSQYQLARSIAVPPRRINEIVHGQRRISADTALRLARFFGTSERFWMNLQSRYASRLRTTGSVSLILHGPYLSLALDRLYNL